MKEIIIANNREHLKSLVENEIKLYGNKCDLNNINVSKITDLGDLFTYSKFTGNISKWDVSNVIDMSGLFANSEFNRDISAWNVSSVVDMSYLFYYSKFKGDISNWRPLKIENTKDIFLNCSAPMPFWFGNNNKDIIKNIESYYLFNKINSSLEIKDIKSKKIKI